MRTGLKYHFWTKNDIAGRDLVQPIQENISNSALFVTDVTYLNLNVTYEVGYAIGQSKRLLLTAIAASKLDLPTNLNGLPLDFDARSFSTSPAHQTSCARSYLRLNANSAFTVVARTIRLAASRCNRSCVYFERCCHSLSCRGVRWSIHPQLPRDVRSWPCSRPGASGAKGRHRTA